MIPQKEMSDAGLRTLCVFEHLFYDPTKPILVLTFTYYRRRCLTQGCARCACVLITSIHNDHISTFLLQEEMSEAGVHAVFMTNYLI